MPLRTGAPRRARAAPHQHVAAAVGPGAAAQSTRRRVAGNFAALSVAEVACRAISVAVTLNLAKRLGTAGYGRVEFAFNLVYWLVLLVREGMDVIAAREIARHPRLVRPVANLVLAIRLTVAAVLVCVLALAGWFLFPGALERSVLYLYGLLLVTAALGLDFVYRGLERMGLVAVSMCVRTLTYALTVALVVHDATRVLWVPALLVAGEACGIALVWARYAREFGMPRLALRRGRALGVFLKRGRSVYLIQVSQAAVLSIDVLVVGLMSGWHDVGVYSASHRMVVAVLTFGLIFQQVAFPTLARSWRASTASGRAALNGFVRVLATAFVPVAVGTTTLAAPLVTWLLGASYAGAEVLLAIEIWRVPLLSLALLYQSALIALNRETAGVVLLLGGAAVSVPLTLLMRGALGLPGAAASAVLTAFLLAVAGFARLASEGRRPCWHHELGRPLLAATAMIPTCLFLARWHVAAGALGGGVVYLAVLVAVGGLRPRDFAALVRRG